MRRKKDGSETRVLPRIKNGDGRVINDLDLCTTETMLVLHFITVITSVGAITGFQSTAETTCVHVEGWSEVITPISVWWYSLDQSSGTALSVPFSNSDNPKMF